jgi:sugar phosphate isomerase/epimerase
MKLGVLTVLFQNRPLEVVFDHVAEMSLQAVELGTGAWPGNAHCNLAELLKERATTAQAFRTVSYGHNQFTWRSLVGALCQTGYDYVLSIEHADPMAPVEEGFSRAVNFLKDALLTEQPSTMWRA